MRGEHEVAGDQMDFLLNMHFTDQVTEISGNIRGTFTDQGERDVLMKAMKERYLDFKAKVKAFTSGLLAPKSEKATKDDGGVKVEEDHVVDEQSQDDEGEIIEVEDNLAAQIDPNQVEREEENVAKVKKGQAAEETGSVEPEQTSSVLCVLCYQVQPSEEVLKTHQKTEHSEDLTWIGKNIEEKDLLHNCGVCSLPFVSWTCLEVHFNILQYNKIYFIFILSSRSTSNTSTRMRSLSVRRRRRRSCSNMFSWGRSDIKMSLSVRRRGSRSC